MQHRFKHSLRRDTFTCFFCHKVFAVHRYNQLTNRELNCDVSYMDLLLRWPPGTTIPIGGGRGGYQLVTIASWAENPNHLGTFTDTTGDIQSITDYHPDYIPQPGHG